LCHFHAGVKFHRHVSGGKMGALSMVIAVPLAVSARRRRRHHRDRRDDDLHHGVRVIPISLRRR
jgi:hypothetical protein